MNVQLLIINLQILKLGKKLTITNLFNKQQHSSFQRGKQIGGRLEVVVLPFIEVPPLGHGQIYIINLGPPPSTKQYEVTILKFL
jgi:hypothetical protein